MVGSRKLHGQMSVNTVESLNDVKHRSLLVREVMFNALHISSISQTVQNKKQEKIIRVQIGLTSTPFSNFNMALRSPKISSAPAAYNVLIASAKSSSMSGWPKVCRQDPCCSGTAWGSKGLAESYFLTTE